MSRRKETIAVKYKSNEYILVELFFTAFQTPFVVKLLHINYLTAIHMGHSTENVT